VVTRADKAGAEKAHLAAKNAARALLKGATSAETASYWVRVAKNGHWSIQDKNMP
jgi:hypothetical protein